MPDDEIEVDINDLVKEVEEIEVEVPTDYDDIELDFDDLMSVSDAREKADRIIRELYDLNLVSGLRSRERAFVEDMQTHEYCSEKQLKWLQGILKYHKSLPKMD